MLKLITFSKELSNGEYSVKLIREMPVIIFDIGGKVMGGEEYMANVDEKGIDE
jgi:hypothetical protein